MSASRDEAIHVERLTAPSQMRASAGSGRGVLVAPDDIAAVSVTRGCRARMRTSSCPA